MANSIFKVAEEFETKLPTNLDANNADVPVEKAEPSKADKKLKKAQKKMSKAQKKLDKATLAVKDPEAYKVMKAEKKAKKAAKKANKADENAKKAILQFQSLVK